jgi:hypothetical protein
MTFATYVIVIISCLATGYMLGVSDGKVEGRIEAFKENR